MTELILWSLVPAMALAAALMPMYARLATAVGLVAAVRPDRLHREARPYGGGLAIADTLLVVIALAWFLVAGYIRAPDFLPPEMRDALAGGDPVVLRLAAGAVLFLIFGLADDKWSMAAGPKLLFQVAAAAVAVLVLGFRATVWLEVPGAAEVVSILWIVAVVNAVNMFDHADGLAAAWAAAALAALAAGQLMMGEMLIGVLALMTAGATAGFLIYNFPPARLFLGDSGTQLLGFLLAALTMEARYFFPEHGTRPWAVLVPLAIMAVPLFDMVCVIVSRISRGVPPWRGDATSHLGHRMLARGISPHAAVLVALGGGAATGAASLLLYRADPLAQAAAWIVVAAVMLAIVVLRRPATPLRT